MSSATLHAARGWIARLWLVFCVIACASAAHAQGLHFAPFGLSELHTDKVAPDSLITDPLSAGWEWQHVYPNVIDDSGKDWRLNTDNIVQLTQNLGLELVLTIWAAKTYNGKSYFPADTTAWKDSVSAVVERYDGDGAKDFKSLTSPIKFWHVEEELSWWGDTWAQYSQYLGITRRAILASDPTAKVICAGLDSNQLWGCGYRSGFIHMPPSSTLNYGNVALDRYEARIDTVLSGGFYDIVDMHSYEQASILKGKCDYVRSLMYDPTLPIWCIEAGGPYLTRAQGYTDTLNAQMVVRQFAEALANGIQRYTWITFEFGPASPFASEAWNNMSLTSGDSLITLKPSWYTYGQLTAMIGGYTSVLDLTARTSTEDRDVFHMQFWKDGLPTDIYWCDNDTIFDAPVTSDNVTITYIYSDPSRIPAPNRTNNRVPVIAGFATIAVGPDPIYLVTHANTAVERGQQPASPDAAPTTIVRAGPSPASGLAHISWRAAAGEAPLRIDIFDVRGRCVRVLPAGIAAGGTTGTARWDLHDAGGAKISPGVYVVRPRTAHGTGSQTRLVVVD